jgi:cell division protein FtsB
MSKVEKIGVYVSIFFILVLLFLIAFSKNGIMDYKSIKGKERVILSRIEKIDIKNKRLEDEIQSLKTNMEYIKHVAKQEHDMAEEGELIFKDNYDKNQDNYDINQDNFDNRTDKPDNKSDASNN